MFPLKVPPDTAEIRSRKIRLNRMIRENVEFTPAFLDVSTEKLLKNC